MHTAIHPLIDVRSGERFEIIFSVNDGAGAAITLDGAGAEYRLARRAGERALISLNSNAEGGITLAGSTAHITVDTAELSAGGKPMLGDFFGQLRLSIGGQTLVAAEGPICIHPVILPAE
ncbi:MAG TPA: hypothetical protein PLW48_07280, partial [Alphaproteobacteria bacterium]|nr:hypothetical protein [Alphaproteobacteria bacterium]